MFPIKDLNRTLTTPHVNRLLLISNILIFSVYTLSSLGILIGNGPANFIDSHFVMVPAEILNGQRLYTLATSMFMHASWYHLFGNMIYLFVFGDNIEDVFGHIGYLAFYLISGVAASLAQIAATLYAPAIGSLLGIAVSSDLTIGVLGASGAISAVLGAYIVLFPKAYVLTFIIIVILPIPAVLFLGFWFVLQWLMGFFNVAGGVAIFAHIGGFILGMIIALTIGLNRKKKLKTKFSSKK